MADCQKEIEATLDNSNPIILLHEADLQRGGETLEQLREDCMEEWRDQIFTSERRTIPWQRSAAVAFKQSPPPRHL